MHPLLKDVKANVLDTIFPVRCLHCQKGSEVLCDACISNFTKVVHQVCIVCKRPSLQGLTHAKCKTAHAPDGLISMLDYHDERVAQAIIYGKYKFLPSIFEQFEVCLSEWLMEENLRDYFARFTVTPLPLAKFRRRWRGFNQAAILANGISSALAIPRVDALVRIRATKTQKDLGKAKRQINVAGAFGMYHHIAKPWYGIFIKPKKIIKEISIENQNIILVDDVVTTGSTLIEATKVLKRNGARSVFCVTLARD